MSTEYTNAVQSLHSIIAISLGISRERVVSAYRLKENELSLTKVSLGITDGVLGERYSQESTAHLHFMPKIGSGVWIEFTNCPGFYVPNVEETVTLEMLSSAFRELSKPHDTQEAYVMPLTALGGNQAAGVSVKADWRQMRNEFWKKAQTDVSLMDLYKKRVLHKKGQV